MHACTCMYVCMLYELHVNLHVNLYVQCNLCLNYILSFQHSEFFSAIINRVGIPRLNTVYRRYWDLQIIRLRLTARTYDSDDGPTEIGLKFERERERIRGRGGGLQQD